MTETEVQTLPDAHGDLMDDLGVSNSDIDWIHRCRELKKLRKKAKKVNSASEAALEDTIRRTRSHTTSVVADRRPSGTFSASSGSSGGLVPPPEANLAKKSRPRRPSLRKTDKKTPKTHVRSSSVSSDSSRSSRKSTRSFLSSLSSRLRRRSRDSAESLEAEAMSANEGSIESKAISCEEDMDMADKTLKLVPFKRVTFAIQELPDEPQQQIPSRHPKKGRVLTPEDIAGVPLRISEGISMGAGGAGAGVGTGDAASASATKGAPAGASAQQQLKVARERRRIAEMEAKKHAAQAHQTALRLAKEVAKYRKQRMDGKKGILMRRDASSSVTENGATLALPAARADGFRRADEPESPFDSDTLGIDTPLHHHVDYFTVVEDGAEEKAAGKPRDPDGAAPSLEKLYARCCHLREILPIPVTLRQLKGKTKPLKVLKMLNPRPTPIDLLSFSDFLAIAPVQNVVFDNVILTTKMLESVLVSLARAQALEKLSLRNVAIDAAGWKYLCKFLTVNGALRKLDISQHRIPSRLLEAGAGASASAGAANTESAEVLRRYSRSSMDWSLFTECLRRRGGIEELVINGCKLTDPQFEELLRSAVSLRTQRLGVADMELNMRKMTCLMEWVSSDFSTCAGIDIASNDLSNGPAQVLAVELKERAQRLGKLRMLASSNIHISAGEAEKYLCALSGLKKLQFVDLGRNPQMFPDIVPALAQFLPKLKSLNRLHLEFNNLTEDLIIELAPVFAQCARLAHVSLLGNDSGMTEKAVGALYSAVRKSRIHTLEIDYSLVSDEMCAKLSAALKANMDALIGARSAKAQN
ncbi:hypothetical protein HII12_004072 [Brettanomyces bruxellensis]|uniref:Uncharacterized protein n=1 Tax=Dekkera bruxellensis TaxID=5007 RepID=A0A8H6ESJ6_DEKBR|nr:hypothetical protein HII12_004072 [Brettanomyces bruxellensis]